MRLAEVLRELTQPGDLYGRFGGTMFTVLVERGTMTDVRAWANQFCKAVANQVFEFETQSTSMTCTIGLCEVRPSERRHRANAWLKPSRPAARAAIRAATG